MKVLIIGAGQIGSAVAAQLVDKPEVEKITLLDKNESRLQEVSQHLNSRKANTYLHDVLDTDRTMGFFKKNRYSHVLYAVGNMPPGGFMNRAHPQNYRDRAPSLKEEMGYHVFGLENVMSALVRRLPKAHVLIIGETLLVHPFRPNYAKAIICQHALVYGWSQQHKNLTEYRPVPINTSFYEGADLGHLECIDLESVTEHIVNMMLRDQPQGAQLAPILEPIPDHGPGSAPRHESITTS